MRKDASIEVTPLDQCLAALEIHLKKLPPEFDGAIAAINRFRVVHEGGNADRDTDLLRMALAETSLSVRTVNALEKIGLFTVGHLLNANRSEILAMPNCGVRTLETIFAMLTGLGFEIPDRLTKFCEDNRRTFTSQKYKEKAAQVEISYQAIAEQMQAILQVHGPLLPGEIAKIVGVSDTKIRTAIRRHRKLFTLNMNGRIENRCSISA